MTRSDGLDGPDAGYPPLAVGSYVIGVLLLAWLIAFLDRQLLSLLVGDVRATLGVSDTQISLLQGLAFTLFYSVAALPLGRLADHSNRRNILMAGIAVWSVATCCCGLAQNFTQLFLARLAVGAGEACLAPAAVSMVADYFPPARRGRALGVMLAGPGLGIALGSLAGGALLKVLASEGAFTTLPILGRMENWRAVFVLASLPAVPLLGLLLTVKEPLRRGKPGAAAAQTHAHWDGGGDGSFLAYVLGHKALLTGLLLIFGMNAIMGYGVITWAPTIFIRAHRMAAGDVGVMLGLVMLCINTIAPFLGGLLSDAMVARFPDDGRLRTLLVTMPASLAFLSLFAVTGHPVVTLVAFGGAAGFSASLNGVCYTALYGVAPREHRGQIVAAYLLVSTFLGLAIGPTAIALATEHLFHADNMVQFSVLLVGGTALVVALALIGVTLSPYRAARRTFAQEDAGDHGGEVRA